MSNLSELLPAGGAAKEFEPVASGTLPNGQAVILKANGQVEAVGETTLSQSIPAGSEAVFNSRSTSYNSIAFDTNNANKFVIAYKDDQGGAGIKGTAIVGTVSGTSISFGTAVVFNSRATDDISISVDPNTANKFVVAYADAGGSPNNQGTVIVGTVSGTSITFGTASVFLASQCNSITCSYNPNTAGQFVVCFKQQPSGAYGRAVVGTVSGTSISYGSITTFNSAETGYCSMSFDPNTANKFVVAYRDDVTSAGRGTAQVGTVSGTSVSFGSKAIFESGATSYVSASYDPNTAGKCVIVCTDDSNSQYGTAIVGTVSGTSISFGTAVVYNSAITNHNSIAFDPNTAGKFVVAYRDYGNSHYNTVNVGTVSGTAISFSGESVVNTGNTQYNSISFDPNTAGKFIVAYKDLGNSNYGNAIVCQLEVITTSLTSTNFVGITAEAITSGATGVVVPQGGVAASVANTPLLQVYGSEAAANSSNSYYVSTSYDPNNANKFVVVWMDTGNSNHGKAVVGTVSGTSISYGTVGTWNAGGTGYISFAFDPNTANKFVIAFQDDGNSGQGTAIVGTISGTSLSFGSEYIFNAANTSYPAISFDPNTAGKFVVAFGDTGKSVVGTVSGTSISYGTVVNFNALTSYISISFDPNTANKFIICYRDRSNANYGKAIVGTISGTSLSYGTEVTFEANSITQMVAAYDPSQANKVVIIYRNDFASDVGVALVGTVSGTTISYGTDVVFNNANTNALNLAFKKTGSNFIITYADNGNSSYGTSIMGTLSGTDVTFKEEVVFNSGSVEYTSISFDDNNSGKYVVAYRDTANSSYSTAISGNLSDALTIGSNYYVQSDGSVSTVSTSPAVNIGKAISATSLILKG